MNKQVLPIKKIFLTTVIFMFVFIFWGLNVDKYANLQLGREVVAGMTYPTELGLINVTVMGCQPSCCTGSICTCCSNGSLCLSDTAPLCPRATVTGIPTGGDGDKGLFLKTSLAAAGISQGGQLIAGGMGITMMDSGTLAGNGGCVGSGCSAINIESKNLWDKSRLAIKYLVSRLKNKLI